MKFQRILAYVTLVIAALTLVYAFGFFTGNLSDLNYYSALKQSGVDIVGADKFVTTAQSFNQSLYIFGIIYIVITTLLFISASSKRRKYYITNYVAIGIVIAAALAMCIFLIVMSAQCTNLFLNDIDWDRLNAYQIENAAKGAPKVSKSTANFGIGFALAVIVLLNAVALAGNLVWKVMLMRGEKALLASAQPEDVKAEEVA